MTARRPPRVPMAGRPSTARELRASRSPARALAAPGGRLRRARRRHRRGRGGRRSPARSRTCTRARRSTSRGAWRRHAAPRLAVRGRARPGARAGRARTRCSPTWARSSTSGPRGAAWLLERHGARGAGGRRRATRARALREVPGIGPRRIGAAVRSWEEQGALRALRLFLDGARRARPRPRRGSTARSARARSSCCRADPYAADARSTAIGFATADALARALGMPPDAPARLDAGVLHALRAGRGRRPLPPPARRAARARAAAARRPTPTDRIDELAAAGRLVDDGRAASSSPAMDGDRAAPRARASRELARRRRRRCALRDAVRAPDSAATSCRPTTSGRRSTRALEQPAVDPHRRPGHRQDGDDARARRPAARQKRSVRLCAPTGKAARRLAEPTGARGDDDPPAARVRARRGLRARAGRPDRRAPTCSSSTRRRCSRVRLADALLGAVGPRTHVLLVGDVDQLAPVGPGRVLEDLIESGAVPTVAPHRDLPPGRALADRARRARDQRTASRRRPSPATTASATSSSSSATGAGAIVRGGRLARRRGASPATTASTRARDVLVLAPMHQRPARHRRAQRRAARGA